MQEKDLYFLFLFFEGRRGEREVGWVGEVWKKLGEKNMIKIYCKKKLEINSKINIEHNVVETEEVKKSK